MTTVDDGNAGLPKMHRRDLLRDIETEVQKWWDAEGQFEAQADPSKESFFVNFPFPYMNGRLHLGHAYSLTKCDFAAAYQRLLGKNVLFPFAFHCTGMPIQAAANKLKREIEQFGNPPNREKSEAVDEGAGKAMKSKIKAKTGGAKLQWDIMEMLNIPQEDIPKFQDPNYWLYFFTPLGERDLKAFGISCDWRRSFITTSENPYFDRFVRWQFHKLRENGKIDFGKRPTVYSTIDKQACADHDRSSGEGVVPQEYTLIKLRIIDSEENYDKVSKDLLSQYKVFLVAATLRPETMYGQTNCFILPDGEYLAIRMKNNEVFVCSERSALNMAYQDMTPVFGKFEVLAKLKGKNLVGCALSGPRTKYEKIYTLPLLTISMKKGTGVVTSVPSDAPDDYAALMDWKNDAKLREKHGVKKEWVEGYDVIPIIDIPGLGNQAAVTLCEQYKVKSQKDKQKLADIKAEVYKKGFYEGIMIVGNDEIKGKKVCDVKDIAKKQMVEANEAAIYYEPENEVKSRSGDECVVSFVDQWYIKYGEETWKQQVKEHINSNNFTAYNSANLRKFNETLDWLGEWACSRSFGLGTRVPWDEQFLIESLSDSTIYMAYYTIAHLFQGRKDSSFTGSSGSPIGIDLSKADEKLTNLLFDYVFLGKKWENFFKPGDVVAKNLNISLENVENMRAEFTYWYPFNLRTSAKDLIQNHLTFTLYNHAAIWPDEPNLWPRSYFTNGQVQVDAEKMSKSAGNFIMMSEAVEETVKKVMSGKETIVGWGADATRFACADAGDTLEDSNFSCDVANNIILRLTNELEFIKSIYEKSLETNSREEGNFTFHDLSFKNKVNYCVAEAKVGYENMRFRDVVKFGFFNLQAARDTYRDSCAKMGIPMDLGLLTDFVEKQIIILSPICKHFSEYVWRKIIGKEGSVTQQKWPESVEVDIVVMRLSEFIEDLISKSRRKADASKSNSVLKVYVSEKFPSWKEKLLEFAKSQFDLETKQPIPDGMKNLKQFATTDDELKPMMKKAMQVGSFILKRSETDGERAFEKEVIFNQIKALNDNASFIEKAIGVSSISVVLVDDLNDKNAIQSDAEPGSPSFELISN